MSRWHRENPEQYEQYGEPDWLGQVDLERKRQRESLPPRDTRPLRPCAACGEPTRLHWCSDACRRAEDGLSFDEADELERLYEDDE